MDTARNKRVPLVGYTDRLSARPGESIAFKLSAQATSQDQGQQNGTTVDAWLTQSICADPNPEGPGIVERSADQWFERLRFKAQEQHFLAGSYGYSRTSSVLQNASLIAFKANIWPTLLNGSIQSIISFGPLSLCINSENSLACITSQQCIACTEPLTIRSWVQVSVTLRREREGVAMILEVKQLNKTPETDSGVQVQKHILTNISMDKITQDTGEFLIAAQQVDDQITHFFNGKIEAPSITVEYNDPANPVAIGWDFSADTSSCVVPGSTDQSPVLTLKNYPTRAMTGSPWRGQEMSWRHAPELYAAIHFHEDDIVDFDWDTTFEWHIPDGTPSGVYLMHISDGTHNDAMPVYVCPPKQHRAHRICVLIPTFTYAIYGNHARPDWEPSWKDRINQWNAYPYNPAEYPGYGLSTYNYHTDGSGICHASHRRPLFNLRPGYITFANTSCSGLRHFQADSHLFSWLDAHDIGFDIITDRELHNEGIECISGYDMLLTTTHPEYHTTQTLDALLQYRDTGGHLSYLGGNGFYWRIALHPEQPDTLEIRRAEDGIRAWAAEPGEYYQAFDGQYGGLWRRNGRPPQALCGLGFSAQGQFNGSYYRRRPVSDDLAWLFEGIDNDIIGDFGLSGGGAAGFELDRADTQLGTPTQATIIATSEQHGEDFILVPEEMLTHLTTLPGPAAKELLHADIIWYELPGGGSVFSVGSITFCGSLPHNNFNNSVSQLLLNVIRHCSAG